MRRAAYDWGLLSECACIRSLEKNACRRYRYFCQHREAARRRAMLYQRLDRAARVVGFAVYQPHGLKLQPRSRVQDAHGCVFRVRARGCDPTPGKNSGYLPFPDGPLPTSAVKKPSDTLVQCARRGGTQRRHVARAVQGGCSSPGAAPSVACGAPIAY